MILKENNSRKTNEVPVFSQTLMRRYLKGGTLLVDMKTRHYWTHQKAPNKEGGAFVKKRPMAYGHVNARSFTNYTAMINVLLLGTSWF